MANSKVKLVYFDLNGRAEIIRLVLTWAGKVFEDFRIKREDWPKYKPNSPFGQLPYVEIDGKTYAQSLAITNFFAAEFNLYGKSNIDRLKIDQWTQLIEDFIQEAAKAFREQDEAKKAEIVKHVKEEVLPKFLANADKLLKDNGGKHFVGDDFTVADLYLYDIASGFLKPYAEDGLKKFPALTSLVDRVGSNKRIKAYSEAHK